MCDLQKENPSNKLTAAQFKAVQHVQMLAKKRQQTSRDTVVSILERNDFQAVDIDKLIMNVLSNVRVTLNFHPDRFLPVGHTVIEGLLKEGTYQSQFVTQMTNGSRTAYPGGDRDRWEQILFGCAYHENNVTVSEKPKYGGLNLMGYADGASPRFGSCYIQLYPDMLNRCTFTFGDSYNQPDCIGTLDVFEPLLAELFLSVEASQQALGTPCASDVELIQRLVDSHLVGIESNTEVVGRALDDYIEAQIHGEISLASDVELLVADPSFKGTTTGDQLVELATHYSIKLLWHPGFRMKVEEVPDDFRGPAIPPFARRVNHYSKTPGTLDASTIGRAAASLYLHPELWQDWANPEETFQHLKQLWHVLVRFG